jgi:hypothetical protein
MAQDHLPYEEDFRRIFGIDPAANWLLNVARTDYLTEGDATPIPILCEIGGPGRDAMLGMLFRMLGFAPPDGANFPDHIPLVVPPDFFVRLRDDPDNAALRDYEEKRIVLSDTHTLGADGPVPEVVPEAQNWPPGTVFVAVIDDGIAFAHDRFLDANGTRIVAFWDMNRWRQPLPVPPLPPFPLPPPVSLPYLPFPVAGELFKAGIDALLPAGVVAGEDAIYAQSGLIDHGQPRHKSAAWRAAHGNHVLDLAAGYDPPGPLPERPIIAVQLPTPVVAQTSGLRLDFHVALATYYILDRVWRLSLNRPPPPVVINTSFGYIAGPHNSTGVVESFFEFVELVTANAHWPTRFVLPAGNAQLSRCHAEIDIVTHADVEFEWIVQPDDRTHSIVQVWLPDRGADRMTMTVVLPDGTASTPIADTPWTPANPGPSVTIADAAGNVCGLLEFGPYLQRSLFHLAIFPTERAQPHPDPLGPAGEWRLRFHRTGAQGVVAHAWVQRDDSLYGYPQAGRQSYFDDPLDEVSRLRGYIRFAEANFALRGDVVTDDEDPAQLGIATPVTRESLFNAIATGASVVTAGGFHERNLHLAGYSAGGPNIAPPEAAPLTKPDVLLPSEGSKAHPGMLAAGSRSGARVALSGTSVAAPQLARFVADRLAIGQPGTRADVVAQANPPNPPPQFVPPAIAAIPETPDPVVLPDRAGGGRLPRPDPLSVERWEWRP